MSSQLYCANQSMLQFVKFKDLWIVCFSQPVLPWLQQICEWGVDQIQWLVVEWGKCGFDKKGQKSIWILCCPASAEIPLPEMQPHCALVPENVTATNTAAVIFLLLLQCKQDDALQNVARKNRGNSCRIPRLQERDKNPQGLLLVAVGGAAASIKVGGGLLKD